MPTSPMSVHGFASAVDQADQLFAKIDARFSCCFSAHRLCSVYPVCSAWTRQPTSSPFPSLLAFLALLAFIAVLAYLAVSGMYLSFLLLFDRSRMRSERIGALQQTFRADPALGPCINYIFNGSSSKTIPDFQSLVYLPSCPPGIRGHRRENSRIPGEFIDRRHHRWRNPTRRDFRCLPYLA